MIQIVTLALFVLTSVASVFSPAAAAALAIAMYVFEQALQGSVGIFASRPALANVVVALVVGVSVARDALARGDLMRGMLNPAFAS